MYSECAHNPLLHSLLKAGQLCLCCTFVGLYKSYEGEMRGQCCSASELAAEVVTALQSTSV